ncbi:transcription antitermination factor NusB [Gulosibacter sediminis]|uniref:transcription antitermination factor NusB n=1 Tax=Gulosibacter sediminis TaxID=1729695 RepID=UPI0024A9EA7D|nr:transcription antitermination factor NusB [Gulosibacter sediminis]
MSRSRTPREVALDVLIAVIEDEAYANLLLPKRLESADLHGTDAAFATQLTHGTLRALGFYDWIIAEVSGRPLRKIDAVALASLRLGAHQLLDTRVAAHAAVNETVNIVRRRAGRGPAGFVNAILRGISRRDRGEWLAQIETKISDARERLAITHAHPRWIVDAFAAALKREDRAGELVALLEADNVAPHVQLAALPGRAGRDELASESARLRAQPAAPTALELESGDPAKLEAVQAHRARVQDAGSQLVALALTRAEALRPGERLLDLCAGPGGKSALVAAETLVAGAEFTANEVTPSRAGLVRQALEPLGEFEVTELDGREFAERAGRFDRILVDAPCTGLGALRRRPEARWRKSEQDVRELAVLQRELLDAALRATAPGGLVAYVTCSPHPAETTEVVERAVAAGAASPLDTRAICGELAPDLDLAEIRVGTGTAVQLWPHRHGTDAMFLALLRTPNEEEPPRG